MSLLEAYAKDPSLCEALRPEEEAPVLLAARRGDERANERIVLAHIRLVISIAVRYRNLGVPVADLVQEGLLGLLHAVRKFEFGRRTKFSTYALFWIRYYIQRGIEERGRSIRLPSRRLRELRRLGAAAATPAAASGKEEDLARATGWSVEKVRLLRSLTADTASLDEEADREGGGLRLVEMISDGGACEAAAIQRALREDLRALLTRLGPRPARVLALRFGMDGGRPRTLQDVARTIGLSPESIRQIERRALDRARRLGETLRTYLEDTAA